MIKYLERLFTNIDRELKNTFVAVRLYGAILVLLLLTFGLYGIVPALRIAGQKLALSREMSSAYNTMQDNFVKLSATKKSLDDNRFYINLLNEYMPAGTNIQSYMLDLIDAAGSQGYTVRSFYQDEIQNKPGQIELSVSLEGSSYPINLVKTIEGLKRVTQVTQVSLLDSGQGYYSVNLVLVIYTLVL